MNARLRWILGLGLLTTAAAVSTVVFWEPITRMRMDLTARRPLWEADVAALDACADPGFSGLSKVLAQDLRIPCPDDWFSRTLAVHLEGRELGWTTRVARDVTRPSRQRLRAAVALLYAGQPAVPGLSFLVTDAEVDPAAYADIVQAVLDESFDTTWVDPVLWADVEHRRFEAGTTEAAASEIRALRLAAAQPGWLTDAERVSRVEAVLAAAGLGDGLLSEVRSRHGAGLAVGLPTELVGFVVNEGGACDTPGTSECLRFAARLLEVALADREDGTASAEAPRAPAARLALPLWRVSYAGDEAAVDAAGEVLGTLSAWIAAGPEGERLERLMGAVANPRSRFDIAALRRGRVGDPVFVVHDRRGAPWSTALAALAVANDVGLTVGVHRRGQGVALSADKGVWLIGPCGAADTRLPEEALGPSWPESAVVAQAAIEAAGAARRGGRGEVALRLATLAARLDPVGAAGVVEIVAGPVPDEPAAALGALGARLAAPQPRAEDPTAVADRRARAADVVASGTVAASPDACPGVLGL